MAKDQGASPTAMRPRSGLRSPAATEPAPKRPSVLALIGRAPQFFREVRTETRKVTWTSWKETWITSVMVGAMVVFAALFFFGVDAGFGYLENVILKIGTGTLGQ